METDPSPRPTQFFFFSFDTLWLPEKGEFFKGCGPHRLTILQWVTPHLWIYGLHNEESMGLKQKDKVGKHVSEKDRHWRWGGKMIMIKIHCLDIWSSQRAIESIYKNFSALAKFFLLHFIEKLKLWDDNKNFKCLLRSGNAIWFYMGCIFNFH